MTSLIIIGAGGLGLEVAAYAEDMARAQGIGLDLLGFADDVKPLGGKHAGCPVLATTDSPLNDDAEYIIAVGQPDKRLALADKFLRKGARFATIIHPQSYVANSAKIGAGCIIAPFAFVGAESQVSDQALLNVYACAGHESHIGRACALSPYAAVHGSATLGERVFMGNGACVTAGVRIGDGVKISAGSVVYSHVPPDSSCIGNPAVSKTNEMQRQ